MKWTFIFIIFALLANPSPYSVAKVEQVKSKPLFFQNSADFSIKNLKISMHWFTTDPHPMSSPVQKQVSETLKQTLQKMGLEVQTQEFKVLAPNLNAVQFGGNEVRASLTTMVPGRNIIATIKGSRACTIVIAGHYDTKFYRDFRFVGANDGGSSTALMLEMARLLKKRTSVGNKQALHTCFVSFVFLDGEESLLSQWNDGTKILNVQDNLYGSRAFAKEFLQKKTDKPIQLAIVIDMIGHKNQNLFITQGSDPLYTQQLLKAAIATRVKMTSTPQISIEDDHTPFVRASVPVIHIIDWTNLAQWHTVKDTPAIISEENIARLGKALLRFLFLPMKELHR